MKSSAVIAVAMTAVFCCMAVVGWAETVKDTADSCVINETDYSIRVNGRNAVVDFKMVGTAFGEGKVSPIFLLDNNSVINEIKKMTGATLLSGRENSGFYLMPNAKRGKIRVHLLFMVAVQEDSNSKFIKYSVPRSIRNRLKLVLPEGYELLASPGMTDMEGTIHFPLCSTVVLRFQDKSAVNTAEIVNVDSFSNITLQGRRALISTCFTAAGSFPQGMTVVVPAGINFMNTSLKSSCLREDAGRGYKVQFPQDEKQSFVMRFAVEDIGSGGFSFQLPYIEDNSGSDGNFIFKEPDDVQVNFKAVGLESIPAKRLPASLHNKVQIENEFMHIPADTIVNIEMQRYKSVSRQSVVLDTQYFFTAFEENGNILSVIIMDVPPEIGKRLKMNAVPDSEIWSLSVNGRKKRVYAGRDGMWVIPLDTGKISHVELAILRKGEKLGLYGKLETTLPETGLQSLNVRVGIALPERVQLLSLEGAVNPDAGSCWESPVEFIGLPYYFSRSFYKGDGIKLSLSYKEPVKNK